MYFGLSRHLHQQVKTELRKRIQSGAYPTDHRIPSESELVAEFQVSATPVRRAIRELISEGLLVGRQGLGVFVTDSRRIVLSLVGDTKTSLADNMRLSGRQPGIRPIGLHLEAASPDTAQRLRLPAGTEVYRHDRVVLADGEAVARGINYLPCSLGDRLGQQWQGEFMLQLLRANDIPIDHIDYAIEGGVADEEDAPVLGLTVGFPLLVVHYTPVAPSGVPILTSCTRSRYDRFRYEVSIPMTSSGPSAEPS
jgi:GntR family transcriptional regulator